MIINSWLLVFDAEADRSLNITLEILLSIIIEGYHI